MTKERKLAIQMWEEIVDKCRARDDFSVIQFKDKFCKENNLNWVNSCYYCQYYPCSKCPLYNCMSIYSRACALRDVASAETILNALKGRNTERSKRGTLI